MNWIAGGSIGIILIILSICITPGLCSSPVLPSGVENPLPRVFPAVESASKPPLLEEGIRATYYATTTSVDSYYSVQPPGKDEHEGKSGVALVQIDVVGIDGNTVATSSTMYIPSGMQAMRPYPGFGSLSSEGCGDFWCSPFWLKSLPEQITSNYKISRIPVTIEGEEYDAIRFDFFQTEVPISLTYDRETGILLYLTNDYTSSPHALTDQTVTNWGSYSILQLQNVRKYDIPWKTGEVPEWVKPGVAISYSGENQLIIPGSQGITTPLRAKLSIESNTARSSYNNIEYFGQLSMAEKTNTGIYSLTGQWKPIEALSVPCGIFDQDPDTGFISSVQKCDQNGIVIRRSNSVDYYEDLTFDGKGMLQKINQVYSPDTVTSVGFSTDRYVILEVSE